MSSSSGPSAVDLNKSTNHQQGNDGNADASSDDYQTVVQRELQNAELNWRERKFNEAIVHYDEALDKVREAKDTNKEAEILLGKGFALSQGGLDFIDQALASMREALKLAKNSGSPAQEKFVQKMIDMTLTKAEEAKLRSDLGVMQGGCGGCGPGTCGCGSGGSNAGKYGQTSSCSNHKASGSCADTTSTDHQELIAIIAANSAKHDTGWSEEEDALLIQLVARDGLNDWDQFSKELNDALLKPETKGAEKANDTNNRTERGKIELEVNRTRSRHNPFTAESIKKHWAEIAPLVKAELADAEKLRACGFTCDTCPTRSTCHLHDAVDIEDI